MRPHGSVYMHWAKLHAAARYNLANSGLLPCDTADLPLEPGDLQLNGVSTNGYPPLLAAIAERYGVQPDQVVSAEGTSGANFLAFAALVEPGDVALVEQPTYEPLLAALAWLGVRVRRFQRRPAAGWAWDAAEIADQLAGGRIRLVVLTNPHNPSGTFAAAAEVAAIAHLAEQAGALLLVDEVYRDIWDDTPEGGAGGGPGTGSHVHLGPNVLATSSLTKCYGLSGLRCGWVLGPAPLVERIRRVYDFMGATSPIPSAALAVAAFRQLPRLAARCRAILEPNRRLASDFLAAHREWIAADLPARSMMVFPRLLREADSQPLHDRLRGLETSIVPGHFFEAPDHFRLGFAVRTADVAQGLENLSTALREG